MLSLRFFFNCILQTYLSSEEFRQKFGMTKDAFYKLPKWKQNKLKMALQLFWLSFSDTPFSSTLQHRLQVEQKHACKFVWSSSHHNISFHQCLDYQLTLIIFLICLCSGGGLKLSGCVRDSISAFLAASAPKKLVFMVDGETQRIFIFIFLVSFSHLLVWMSSFASF